VDFSDGRQGLGGIFPDDFKLDQKGEKAFECRMMLFHPAIADLCFSDLAHPFEKVATFTVDGVDVEAIFGIVTIMAHAGDIGLHCVVGKLGDMGQLFSICINKGDHGLPPEGIRVS
jgi:hypothetical protein